MGAIVFPHMDLDVIVGKPTNTSVQKLKRPIYTNAKSVTSPRGGGTNGPRALVMPVPAYLVRAGVAFMIPDHPGRAAPVHAAGATAAMIAETIRLYNQQPVEHTLYNRVSTEITSQILRAVDITWLRELENADFGFADVTHVMIIEHLEDNYAVLTPEALEANRTSLSDAWNSDQPIENLLIKIFEIQRIATAGTNANISDVVAAITLMLAMFKQSRLLAITTQQWRERPIAQWTMATFKSDFSLANTDRIRETTAAVAGYHGANAVTLDHQADANAPDDTNAAANAAATPLFVNVQGGHLYYCWTHGLSPTARSQHTSITAEIRMPDNRPPHQNHQRSPACRRLQNGRGRGANN
jgi:uncharacterized phage-associated protein